MADTSARQSKAARQSLTTRTFQQVVFGHPLTSKRLFMDTSWCRSWYMSGLYRASSARRSDSQELRHRRIRAADSRGRVYHEEGPCSERSTSAMEEVFLFKCFFASCSPLPWRQFLPCGPHHVGLGFRVLILFTFFEGLLMG